MENQGISAQQWQFKDELDTIEKQRLQVKEVIEMMMLGAGTSLLRDGEARPIAQIISRTDGYVLQLPIVKEVPQFDIVGIVAKNINALMSSVLYEAIMTKYSKETGEMVKGDALVIHVVVYSDALSFDGRNTRTMIIPIIEKNGQKFLTSNEEEIVTTHEMSPVVVEGLSKKKPSSIICAPINLN